MPLKVLAQLPYNINWRPSSLSDLTPMLFNTGLTQLDSEPSNSSNATLPCKNPIKIVVYIPLTKKLINKNYSNNTKKTGAYKFHRCDCFGTDECRFLL